MTPRQRATAEFYASVASIRAESGDSATLARLLPRFERILALSAPGGGKRGPKPSQATVLAALADVQRETATLLRTLLRGETAAIPAPLRTVPPTWRLADGQVTETWESRSLSTDKSLVLRGLAPLIELIRLPRFPFGLCSVCDTVFVRGINQKYCSSACMDRGIAEGRRDERRPYMRFYMRKYRAAQRATEGEVNGQETRRR